MNLGTIVMCDLPIRRQWSTDKYSYRFIKMFYECSTFTIAGVRYKCWMLSTVNNCDVMCQCTNVMFCNIYEHQKLKNFCFTDYLNGIQNLA